MYGVCIPIWIILTLNFLWASIHNFSIYSTFTYTFSLIHCCRMNTTCLHHAIYERWNSFMVPIVLLLLFCGITTCHPFKNDLDKILFENNKYKWKLLCSNNTGVIPAPNTVIMLSVCDSIKLLPLQEKNGITRK